MNCLYCDDTHDHQGHRVTIHFDEWENLEYRPINTIVVKGGIL